MLSKKLLSLLVAVLTAGTIASCGPISNPSTSSPADDPTSTPADPTTNPTTVDPTSDPTTAPVEDTYYTVTFYDDGRIYGSPVSVKEGETVEAPKAPSREGNEFVSYEFSGWFTAGAETAYDFATPVTGNLDLYSSFAEVARTDYDLVVFVYGVNAATSPTTYIKETESTFMHDTFVADKGHADKNILWHYVAGKKNADFNSYVVNSALPVDVVISGNKLDNDTTNIATHATYGKVHLGDGWIENTSRYLTITEYCDAAHFDLALELYTMLSNLGPNYKISLDSQSVSLEIGETKQLTATYYGSTVTWSSDNTAVATVKDGLVTAVSAGTAIITAKDAIGNEAKCEVSVSAAPIVPDHDLVIVLNNSNASNVWMSEQDANDLINAFKSEGQPGYGKDIELNIVSGVNIAGVVEQINTINANDLGRVDVALCRSAFFTNKSCPALLADEALVDVSTTWGYSGGQVGIFANAFEEHIALAREFAAFAGKQNIDFFEIEESVSIKISETYQLTTTATDVKYTSKDTEIVTVSSTGLITPVATGNTSIFAEKGYYTVEISVTVKPNEVVAVTLNIYVHISASKTTYIDDAAYEAIQTTVAASIGEEVTINWTKITGKNNAGVTTTIDEAEELVHLAICAKASIEGTAQGAYEGYAPAKCASQYAASGESRYVAPLAGISAAELAACLLIYNALKA